MPQVANGKSAVRADAIARAIFDKLTRWSEVHEVRVAGYTIDATRPERFVVTADDLRSFRVSKDGGKFSWAVTMVPSGAPVKYEERGVALGTLRAFERALAAVSALATRIEEIHQRCDRGGDSDSAHEDLCDEVPTICAHLRALQDVADEAKKALSGAHGYVELAKKLSALETLQSRGGKS